ncbi:MAG: cytochrome c [Bryobacteraceae bacterium]
MTTRTVLFGILIGGAAFAASPTATPTFNKDVLPVLQKNCQGCHRPGEAGPMSLLDYKQTRPWAKAIKQSVSTRKMPPWGADPHFGKFQNDRLLSTADIKTLVSWADSGAPEGNPKDAPKPVSWLEGWAIGQPDVVLEMPAKFPVPASGTIDYQYVVIPTGFTEDKWVQMAEARPGDRSVTHHVIAFLRPPGSKWMADAKPGVPFVPQRQQRSRSEARDPQQARNSEAAGESMAGTELLVGYAPGMQPQECPPGAAKFVPKGSDIVLQLHYTTTGKATADKTRIGLIFAKEAPQKRILTMNATNAGFVIPAGDSDYEVKSSITLREDAELVGLMPHMHLRGKDFLYKLTYPTGEQETILSVPKYDFNWQLFYYLSKPKLLPKDTRIDCTAHFDNSANNPANPDATKAVRWGDQSWEEMMIGWFDVAIDAKGNPMDLFRTKPSGAAE